jgi:succinate dehydrogenase / fumarate reductase, flavoprotein subunit
MPLQVPQSVLDALTDVDMPRLPPDKGTSEGIDLAGLHLPLYRTGCLVIGSGAAGLRTAVELARRNVDVAIISQSAWGGTSACSGSDKQTIHTANTADRGDDFHTMAQAIAAGGAMDADTAYIEAIGSVRSMASLQYLGLPLPQDRLGGTLRYQTDHDEVGRATSCGPRTSRLMVRVLADEALRLGVPIHNQTTALRLLVDDDRLHGAICARPQARTAINPYGLSVVAAKVAVLAGGGPGELYRDSVYPNGCFGTLGLAVEAGLDLVNLTESQFGIGTRREGFPWNLSGTYVQAMPHIFSIDTDGREHHFLSSFYRTTQELASNIFRKGYQWPFHATRMLDFGSSLVDLAIAQETAAGRRVFMDFNRNPLAVPGDSGFSLDRIDPDVRAYLGAAGAVQALPIDRLRHMNPLSIELYRRYKMDIAAEPLEFAVNNQHMNGGVAVDIWGRSSHPALYAVGEAAGTHGVTRPGGAALNAGQVFGTRAAEHIAATLSACPAPEPLCGLEAALSDLLSVPESQGGPTVDALRDEVQARMSDSAGILCEATAVRDALHAARVLNDRIARQGITIARPSEATRALQWRQMALASEAVLTALDHYISGGGGSRGARAILDPQGEGVPMSAQGPLDRVRFRAERPADRDRQIIISHRDGGFRITERMTRTMDQTARPVFERDWPAWLTGAIYRAGPEPR